MVQPTCVSAVLVPVGVGLGEEPADRAEFGQCLCVDWFPSNKEVKVAAGFSNGMENQYPSSQVLPFPPLPAI